MRINPDKPLEFATDYNGHWIRLELSARTNCERPNAVSDEEWMLSPVSESSIAIAIFVDGLDQPIERHHIDFAEPGQSGPQWHLQAGGNPAGYEKFESTWLKVPRWPLPPADLTLFVEVVVANFFETAWHSLTEDGQWTNIIQRSEDLMLSEYARQLSAHLNRGQAGKRDGTWLSMQTATVP